MEKEKCMVQIAVIVSASGQLTASQASVTMVANWHRQCATILQRLLPQNLLHTVDNATQLLPAQSACRSMDALHSSSAYRTAMSAVSQPGSVYAVIMSLSLSVQWLGSMLDV